MISRFLNISKLLKNKESAFLFGPRGVGKSYLSSQFVLAQKTEGRPIFELDLLSLKTQSRYTENPELFRTDIEYQLQQAKGDLLVFIDEVQ